MSLVDEFELSNTVIAERFSVGEPIAEGGFGLVYRGQHLGFDRPVAIKCLRIPERLDQAQREEFLRRFTDEGRLLFELSNLHAGIVRAIETGTVKSRSTGDVPYLVLEWLEGETLEGVMEHRISRGHAPLSLPEIIAHLSPVADALAAAHERGVVHRDIKPSNIVFADVMGKRTAKVLDFGIAKVMHEAWSVTSAKTSRVEGSRGMFTPAYAAPEQWVTRFGATGPWTDVFSFALVCVELLSNQPALEGPAIPQFLGQCIDETERPTPKTRGAEISGKVEAIFQKALAVEPAERYPDVASFWGALVEEASSMATPDAQRLSLDWIGSQQTTIYGSPVSLRGASQPKPLPPSATRRSVRPLRMMAIALPLLAIAVVGGWFAFFHESEPPPIGANTSPNFAPSAATIAPAPTNDWSSADDLPTTAQLTVLCVPYCSDVQVDGKSLGPSPLLASDVATGRRDLVLRRDGTPDKHTQVVLDPGTRQAITVSMDP